MRKISLEQIQPGMVLAKTIYGQAGQVLLSAGMQVKPQYTVYLKHLGIDFLYVKDSRMEDVVVDDLLTEETRRDARILIEEIMDGSRDSSRQKSLTINDEKLMLLVIRIIDELLANRELVANLQDIRTATAYAFAHCVNTCVLATLAAAKLHYDVPELKMLATGCLLHDLGYVVVPREILEKKQALDQDEFELIKNHPLFGFELFKHSSLFTDRAGAVIYQHHERQNGGGYPRGLAGDDINILAQIAAIADIYDALTSTRPYRRAYQPHQAVEMFTAWGEEYFNLEILRTFLSFIAAYPVGCHVVLSNGNSGLVIANTPGFTLRPTVRVLYTGEGMALLNSPYDIDLTETLDLTITNVVG
ncbi:MAG: HD-GYP domain-containing protein [Bacillota bacterium]